MLANGRVLNIAHASVEDAAELVAYLEQVSGESDFLTFGPGEFGLTTEQEATFISDLAGGSFNFLLVGRAMCLRMLQVARQNGVTKVNLKVREDNTKAIRLYESVGFVREGSTARALRIGDAYFSDVLMGVCLD